MKLHLPVAHATYRSAVTEAADWRADYQRVSDERTDLLARNGVLTAQVEEYARKLAAANTAAEGLRSALEAGAVTSQWSAARDEGAQVLALQKELSTAREQIARQGAALDAYERDHQGLLDDLRRLTEQRDTALATVERMSLASGWTPEGVSA